MTKALEERKAGPEAPRSIWRRAVPHLAPILRPRWKMLFVAALALVMGVGFDLLKPWPLKFVIDYLAPGKPFLPDWIRLPGLSESAWLLALVCALIVAAAMVSAFAAYFRAYLMNRVGEELAFELRVAMFGHLQRLGLAFHDSKRLGDTITRITEDTRSIRDLATTSMLEAITASATVLFMLGAMLVVDWRLGLLGVLAVPILGPIVWYFRNRIEKASQHRRKREGELTSVAQETMSSIRLVTTMGREAQQQRAFGKESSGSAQIGLEVARLEAAYVRTVEFVVALLTCAVVAFGVQRVWSGAMTVGTLTVFAYYVKNLYGPMRDIAKQSTKIAKGKVGLERVLEVLDTKPSVTESPVARSAPHFTGRIAFEDVGFEYRRGQPSLRDVNLQVEPGQVIALVGHSGAGKSTILTLLSRLYDPTAGRILLDGQDIREFTLGSLRDQISVVLQDSVLLQASIAENIRYGRPDATPEEAAAAASAAGVDQFIDRLPDGYETVVGPRGATLSGGERQRVAIARAIVRDAPILLLDEPTTGLDAVSEQLVMRALTRLMKGRTTIVVSHKLSLIERADQILVIDAGCVVESGTRAQLLRVDGYYARLQAASDESGEIHDGPPSLVAGEVEHEGPKSRTTRT